MKILLTVTYYSPYISGLSLYVKVLAENLAKRGRDVSVLCWKHNGQLAENQEIEYVRIIRAKPQVKINKGFFGIDFLVKSFREVRITDVVVINLPQPEGIVLAVLSKLFSKKLISIYHCEVEMQNKIQQSILDLSNSICLKLSNQIVTYTHDYAINSRVLRPFIKKVKTVFPPVTPPKTDKKSTNILKKLIGTDKNIVIGFAGRLATEKGIEFLLETVPILKKRLINRSFVIVIAGPIDPVGESNYKNKILELIKKYHSHVVLLGSIEPSIIGSFYSLIDVLVLPSINSTEAFGIVQVEAMMMGVPVVATDLPGVRIPIKETGFGRIVNIRNSENIVNSIIEIVDHRSDYKKDPKVVKEIFSLFKCIDFYEKLFD